MNSSNKRNLDNVKNIFQNKTDVELDARKSIHRPFRTAIALVAAIVCCLTVTALAVNYFSGGVIIEFFRYGASGYADHHNELSDAQLLTIENCTTQINQSIEADGTTVTLKYLTGAVTSNNFVCYYVFEVETPENALDGKDNDDLTFEMALVKFNDMFFANSSGSGHMVVMDDEQGRDNVKTVILTWVMAASGFGEDVHMTVKLDNFWIERNKRSYTEMITEGTWSFDLYVKLNMGIKLNDEPILLENGVIIDNLEISPLGGSYTAQNSVGIPLASWFFDIVMKDGTVLTADSDDPNDQNTFAYGGGSYDEDLNKRYDTFYFDTPLELTDIDYILFADGTRVYIQ